MAAGENRLGGGIPSERLSFDLINEPSHVEPKAYVAVVRKLVQAIRGERRDRLIISDGLQWSTVPVLELRTSASPKPRGATPSFEITHYKASWVNGGHFPYPQWPRLLPPNGTLLSPQKPEGLLSTGDRRSLHNGHQAAAARADGFQPSALLAVEADGEQVFQVLDSDRDNVQYENFEGHKLDRKFLDLLRRY